MKRRLSVAVLLLLIAMVMGYSSAANTSLSLVYPSGAPKAKWLDGVISDFQKQYPFVGFDLMPIPSGGPFIQKLTVLVASGTPPDVLWAVEDKPGYIHKGWIMDLAPFIERDNDVRMDDFLPWTIDAWRRGNAQYGLPMSIDIKGMLYNTDLINQAGMVEPPLDWESPNWTWTIMRQYAKKLTLIRPDGSADRFGLQVQISGAWGLDIPWLFGGDWFSQDSYALRSVQKAVINQPANVAAYSELVDMLQHEVVMPGGAVSWAPGVRNSFKAGGIGMQWRAGWRLRSYSMEGLPFSWGLAPYPMAETRKNTMFVDPLVVGASTRFPEEAWAFVKFATNTENLAAHARDMNAVPARRSSIGAYLDVISEQTGLSKSAVQLDLEGAVRHAQPNIDVLLRFSDLERAIRKELQPMFAGQVSVNTALEKAQKTAEDLLHELNR